LPAHQRCLQPPPRRLPPTSRQQPIDHDRPRLPLHGQRLDRLRRDRALDQPQRLLADQHLPRRPRLLQPARHIPRIPRHHPPTPPLPPRACHPRAHPVPPPPHHPRHPPPHLPRRTPGPQRIVLPHHRPPNHRHHRIPGDLLPHPPVPLHHPPHPLEIPPQKR